MSETTAEYRVKNKNRKMNNNTRNDFASYGLEILKRAVLSVLYETDQPYLRYKDIQKASEICEMLRNLRNAAKNLGFFRKGYDTSSRFS